MCGCPARAGRGACSSWVGAAQVTARQVQAFCPRARLVLQLAIWECRARARAHMLPHTPLPSARFKTGAFSAGLGCDWC